MSAALLPPDPTKSAGYWVWEDPHKVFVWYWSSYDQKWIDRSGAKLSPEDAWDECNRLQSPHPILSAAQLDALWELAARVVAVPDRPDTFESGYTRGILFVIGKLRAALKGDAP